MEPLVHKKRRCEAGVRSLPPEKGGVSHTSRLLAPRYAMHASGDHPIHTAAKKDGSFDLLTVNPTAFHLASARARLCIRAAQRPSHHLRFQPGAAVPHQGPPTPPTNRQVCSVLRSELRPRVTFRPLRTRRGPNSSSFDSSW